MTIVFSCHPELNSIFIYKTLTPPNLLFIKEEELYKNIFLKYKILLLLNLFTLVSSLFQREGQDGLIRLNSHNPSPYFKLKVKNPLPPIIQKSLRYILMRPPSLTPLHNTPRQ